jgi:plasmid stabilization system protein ParE
MKIRYSPRARNDLTDIFHYLNERSPSGAENVMRAIYASIEFLAENPRASQETGLSEIRVKIVRRGDRLQKGDATEIDAAYSTLAPRCRSASICSRVPPPKRAR